MESLLGPYRALDLTDEKGFFCGKILGDLGANVIKIEPPEGDPARRMGPFWHDEPNPEKSLPWMAYNTSKRGITLNLESSAGRDVFHRLAKTADFIIESFPPGHMDRLGLGYSSLSQTNPGLIMASISPFGQTGPYRDYKASELIAMAMGGMAYITGDPDRPPVRISVPQAYAQAGAHAAVGIMIALHHRSLTGEGQWVDVSIQQSVVRTLHTQLPYWEYSHIINRRSGARRFRGAVYQPDTWPCKDGYMAWTFFGGAVGAPQMRRLVEWMDSEGMAGSLKAEVGRWAEKDMAKLGQEEVDSWAGTVSRFFLAHTREELYQEAIERGVPLSPANSPGDVFQDEQLRDRGFWVELAHPELDTLITYPGPLFLSSEATPRPRFRAPLIGEHNQEIYGGELGLSREELATLKAQGAI